ncbi:MAG: oligosaccharide flippase family protein, partial [Actinobacteria bacterium]|nr:oligosaccharide flippase family protein [Actinomycetota bacterium]
FFLSSLKTIPSIILERQLKFEKLVIPQIVENLFFYIIAVILAAKGFGVASFTFAVLARGISGVIVIYIINPWRISFGFQKEAAKKLLSFGIPFQTNSVLALLKDDLFILFLGRILPLAQVGYIGFAQKWAFMPLRLIMDNVIRVTFPSFSRLQHDKDVLRTAIEKSIFAACFLIFPALMGLVVLAPYFVHLIPKYIKWEPAILSLSFFAINASLSSVSTPLTNALNAIGKIKVTLYLMVFWTISTWVLTPIFILLFGFSGVSFASALIGLSVILVILIVKRYINFSITKIVINPILATVLMGGIIYFVSPIFVKNILTLVIMIVFGVVVYFSTMFILAKNEIISDIKLVRENLKK